MSYLKSSIIYITIYIFLFFLWLVFGIITDLQKSAAKLVIRYSKNFNMYELVSKI